MKTKDRGKVFEMPGNENLFSTTASRAPVSDQHLSACREKLFWGAAAV